MLVNNLVVVLLKQQERKQFNLLKIVHDLSQYIHLALIQQNNYIKIKCVLLFLQQFIS